MKDIFIAWFGAIVIVIIAVRGLLDLAASIEYAQEIFPWLKNITQSKRGYRLLLSLTCLFYGGTLYELLQEPPPFIPAIQNPGALPIVAVAKENRDLREKLAVLTEPESPDSLRRRTVAVAAELADFWVKNPPPYYPGNNPNNSDPEKLKAYTNWSVRVDRTYKEKYQGPLLGIIRTYKQLGIPTGYLEAAAENHIFGEFPYSGAGMQPPFCQVDEVCQVRQLAWFVDSKDRPVVTF
jgi:hypothetical protein